MSVRLLVRCARYVFVAPYEQGGGLLRTWWRYWVLGIGLFDPWREW
jgi:hypothetical protein